MMPIFAAQSPMRSIYNMHINSQVNSQGDNRKRLVAADAVKRMNGQMRYKLDAEDQARLAAAIVRSDAQDDLLFRPRPVRHVPSVWSLAGLLSRLALWMQGYRKRSRINDGDDHKVRLSEMHYRVRQSGAVGLVIALMAALVCGAIEFGLPAELMLQVARDKARPIAASGDVVVIAQDDKSADVFGRWPWPRRHDAALIDRLREAGVKTIVFNQSFSQHSDAENDAAFAAALDRAGGRVWLSAQFEKDPVSGVERPILPLPLFRAKSRQANSYVWYDAFATSTKNVPFSYNIGGRAYPSNASVLAGVTHGSGDLRPDSAIDYRTIPTVSMLDVVEGRVDRAALAGKSVIISPTIYRVGDLARILWQGQAPAVYTRAIAAETIKNGVARQGGWLAPLIAAALIALLCVVQSGRRRGWTLVAGGAAMIIAMLIFDRMALHFEMMPALLLLMIIGTREAIKRQILQARSTHAISGFPLLSQLHQIKGHERATVLALKVEQYQGLMGSRSVRNEREMIHSLAARIGIVCPNSVVHQGDDGLFAWLVQPGSAEDYDSLPGHLHALFMVPIAHSHAPRIIGISVGRCDDQSLGFAARLAVAVDRAKASAYITLREVL